MQDSLAAQILERGFAISDKAAISPQLFKNAFINFLNQPLKYQKEFIQKHFTYAFDGFSYLGQTNSTNQGVEDLVYTFVFSEFHPPGKFPPAFSLILNTKWQEIKAQITALEILLISELDLTGLEEFYQGELGHMVSCNYYPPLEMDQLHSNYRLTEHPDVSLFTVFPFGLDGELEYCDKSGEWKRVPATENMLIFPGYLLEKWTYGECKALNHRVAMPTVAGSERFSFAFFSLPYPRRILTLAGREITSEDYFSSYLSLFES